MNGLWRERMWPGGKLKLLLRRLTCRDATTRRSCGQRRVGANPLLPHLRIACSLRNRDRRIHIWPVEAEHEGYFLEASDSDDEEDGDPYLPTIRLTYGDKKRFYRRWKDTLVVKWLGKRVGYRFLHHTLVNQWRPHGEIIMADMDNDFYLLQFTNNLDYNRELYDGPWIIADHVLIVRRWQPCFDLDEAHIKVDEVTLRSSGAKFAKVSSVERVKEPPAEPVEPCLHSNHGLWMLAQQKKRGKPKVPAAGNGSHEFAKKQTGSGSHFTILGEPQIYASSGLPSSSVNHELQAFETPLEPPDRGGDTSIPLSNASLSPMQVDSAAGWAIVEPALGAQVGVGVGIPRSFGMPLPMTLYFRVEAQDFSGGLWALWRGGRGDVQVIGNGMDFIHLEIQNRARGSWIRTAVYVNPDAQLKQECFDNLLAFPQSNRRPWVLIGDFNELTSPSEE
ncbi:hypothetical protein Tsubulata_028698 [Turnera subulata]|uniref:DUF4283 domain-containing protein n=1 Tax=Turnera subulata TaxID=218843 RepID=A0A9Q0G305_9ROSI|nr:hypothetical protein Tsubulata_028698 [Turnera subulata]